MGSKKKFQGWACLVVDVLCRKSLALVQTWDFHDKDSLSLSFGFLSRVSWWVTASKLKVGLDEKNGNWKRYLGNRLTITHSRFNRILANHGKIKINWNKRSISSNNLGFLSSILNIDRRKQIRMNENFQLIPNVLHRLKIIFRGWARKSFQWEKIPAKIYKTISPNKFLP